MPARSVSVAISGNLLAIGAFYDNAVTLVDITDPSNPIKLSELKDGVGGFNNLSSVYDVALSPNGLLAIAGAYDHAVTLVSVTNPANPVLLAELINGTNGLDSLFIVNGVAFSGNWLAVLATGAADVPIHAPSAPAQVKYQLAHSGARAAIVSGRNQAAKVLDAQGGTLKASAEEKLKLGLHNWLEAHVLRREAEALRARARR